MGATTKPNGSAVARTQHSRKGVVSRKGPPTQALTSKLFSFLTHVALLAVWKTLWTLSIPIGKVIALNLWLGRSALTLSIHLQHQVLKAIGWLSTPALPPYTRLARAYRKNMGSDVKNWHVGIATLVAFGVITSAAKKWQQRMDARHQRQAALRRLMTAASSYEQWREIAGQLYALEEADMPAGDVSTRTAARLYDRKLLQDKTAHLKRVHSIRNVKEIMLALRTDLIRNIANIAKSQLHEHFVAVPEDIADYINEMKKQLEELVDWHDDELPPEEKLAFFRETRHTFGRTALLLSGGGGLGTFHIGVAKALFEQRLLPRVLAGSSVGSIVCGIIGSRTDAELRDLFSRLDTFDVGFFSNSRAVELVQHLINKGSLQDMSFMIKKLRSLMGDSTFLEAYERTGRILNVTVCPADTNEPPRLLNYLTAPNALVWSAVAASSAFPGLYPAQHILARNSRGEIIRFSAQSTNDSLERRWRDGSLELDLPVQALGEMFNCNHFLVSQTNPHIVPLLNLKKAFSRKWANILEAELKHRCQVLQWLLPDWVPSKWLMLFTQAWEGDITMTLPSALWHLGKTIVNPTTAELIRSVKVGELATWEKLAAIECNCSLEATLDKCLAALTNRARGIRTAMGKRVPSWLHMSAMGLPAVASWGDQQFAESRGIPHNASWGGNQALMGAAAAAAGGGGGKPVPGMSPAAAVSLLSQGIQGGVGGGAAAGGSGLSRSVAHPMLNMASNMTSSTLALLNLGAGSPVNGSFTSPARGPALGTSPKLTAAGLGGMAQMEAARGMSLDGRSALDHSLLYRRGSDGGVALPIASAAGGGALSGAYGGYGAVPVSGGIPVAPGSARARGAGVSAPPPLATWLDAASECEDSASDAAAAATGSGAASTSAGGMDASSNGSGQGISKELLDLAHCDCTDASAMDLWSVLLPLAKQSLGLEEQLGHSASTAGLGAAHQPQQQSHRTRMDHDGLDVFAY